MLCATSILSPIEGLADCVSDIQICDRAVQALKAEVKISDLAIKQSTGRIATLTQEVQDANSALAAWYRNPYLLLAIGFGAGVFIAK